MFEHTPHRTPSGDLELLHNETIGIKVPNTSVVIRGKLAGCGELFVTSQRVAWLADNATSFALNYISIVLHALSTDPQACDRPCLYCQIKGDALPTLANGHPSGIATSESVEAPEEDEGLADDDAMIELKFIPDDSSYLQRLFAVMSEMAALHPEPDSGALDGDEEELFDEAALRRQGWEFVENEGDDAAESDAVDA
ncbi:chloride channel, nucleotide-sensitive, 1A, putative [Eimeria tenella]|uniref:Chloride channel, nucleotide-sensitive, 1A, putative n=1 Tax=Eimeria tenella TaxID=5802 RepID=U6L9S6_EIMTE|nr:chloride channel, nucleotide-sensitive, 1A, putative [Eimeria tenella]CDJ45329.1 chloride channel, nucleotide-sensitive, 1A, putative [Eimeria tenella]|eukprot:XP_013236075.1 chloride channel, nucleotide-sensitive, 1A, putative [Eimeria tenella]